MGGADFSVTLWVSLFLFSIWAGGRLFGKLKLPPILGFFLIGILFGPAVFDVVPFASNGLCDSVVQPLAAAAASASASASGSATATGRMLAAGSGPHVLLCDEIDWKRWNANGYLKNIWKFLGETGVTLMIFESGMHIHFDKVAQIGLKALVVAIFGTLLPLLVGMVCVGALFNGDYYPSGFAAGCAFAPTSVGISIHLLEESKMLGSMAGQTTLTAAFIDDVFSLITLVIMQTLAVNPVLGPREIIVPIVGSVVILGGCVVAALYGFNHLPKLLDKIPKAKFASIPPRDEMQLFIMMFTLALLGFITWYPGFIGSHLLGAFGAGMCFVNVPRSHSLWQAQTKRVVRWLVKLFFAATVGFSVPIKLMMTGKSFGYGAILGVLPVIGCKIVSGLFAPMKFKSPEERAQVQKASWVTRSGCLHPQQLLVGMAMVARGEFAYLVASEGVGLGMMTSEVYASVMWALVFATIFSPISFRWALGVFERAFPMERASTITAQHTPRKTSSTTGDMHTATALDTPGVASAADPSPSSHRAGRLKSVHSNWHTNDELSHSFGLRIAGKFHWGVHREIIACLYSLGVYVVEAKVFAIDDPATQNIDHFIGVYHLLARGKKLDFDEDKLEEMHHGLSEVVRDDEAQILFQALEPEFAVSCLVEVRIEKITDKALAEMETKILEEGLELVLSRKEEPSDYSPKISSADSPGKELTSSLQRRKSMGGGGHKSVPMTGLVRSERPHAQTIYLRDTGPDTHFSDSRREKTRHMLLSIMKAHDLLPAEEKAKFEAELEAQKEKAASNHNGSTFSVHVPGFRRSTGPGGRKTASSAHAHKEGHSLQGSVQVRVLHEAEAPADVDMPPTLILPQSGGHSPGSPPTSPPPAPDAPAMAPIQVVTLK